MRAVIIANGKVFDYEKIKKYIKKGDYIICADGGYDHAIKLGVTPDVLIGDMDSVKSKDLQVEKIVYPKRKDWTDSEIVIDYARGKGFDELVLLGFTGGRADHMLTNIFMLVCNADIDMLIADENSEIKLAKKDNIVFGKKGDIVSIIPINGNLENVSTENLEYPLNTETLYFGEGRGVSNVMTSDKCRITIGAGQGLIIKSVD